LAQQHGNVEMLGACLLTFCQLLQKAALVAATTLTQQHPIHDLF
jgi:hypothetical protein